MDDLLRSVHRPFRRGCSEPVLSLDAKTPADTRRRGLLLLAASWAPSRRDAYYAYYAYYEGS
ncbi:hypothetical protein DDE01_15170 [Desulfovibrio desulfuricans]|nr:hypothetical protein DDE01_15170 [Desulfovibrio desulfuricans]